MKNKKKLSSIIVKSFITEVKDQDKIQGGYHTVTDHKTGCMDQCDIK